jgi:hypothetical protein
MLTKPKTLLVNSMKVEFDGRDVVISTTHTPENRIKIEHADIPDLLRAIDLLQAHTGKP